MWADGQQIVKWRPLKRDYVSKVELNGKSPVDIHTLTDTEKTK